MDTGAYRFLFREAAHRIVGGARAVPNRFGLSYRSPILNDLKAAGPCVKLNGIESFYKRYPCPSAKSVVQA